MAVAHELKCKVCNFGHDRLDWTGETTNKELSQIVDCSKDSIARHKTWVKKAGLLSPNGDELEPQSDWRPLKRWGKPGDWRYSEAVEDEDLPIPAWPVIDRPAPLPVTRPVGIPLVQEWHTAVVGADTQIGFRRLEDGTLDPFHDDRALALFNQLVEIENPDQVVLAGDIIDLPEQSRWAQELGFAGTTQKSIDRTYEWLANMRARTYGDIHLIEGNHDKRLQNFVETNAISAFGLKRAGWPDEWPVMSIPYLLRLSELEVEYYDAYPNAHVWVNNILRAEHGTKANSNGSTAQKYLDDTPHISRIIGHSHRQEIVQRTTWDRMGRIMSQVVNPGCLCRVDGAVPGFNSSIGARGNVALSYEDWQQGAAIIRYNDDKFFSELIQFDEGMTVYHGEELRVE